MEDDEVIKNEKYFLKLHKREFKTYSGLALSTIVKKKKRKNLQTTRTFTTN